MDIYEIQPDSRISVTVTRGDASVSFASDIVAVMPDCVYVVPFKHNETIVNFNIPDVLIEMVVTRENEVPFSWKIVHISKEIYENNVVHCIKSTVVGVKLNRRNAFRVFVGENGYAASALATGKQDVLIKDLSSTGVGFLVDSSSRFNPEVGKDIFVVFTDDVLKTTFNVAARIVRTVDIPEKNQQLFGCKFLQRYPMVDRYCATKQLKSRQLNARQPLRR